MALRFAAGLSVVAANQVDDSSGRLRREAGSDGLLRREKLEADDAARRGQEAQTPHTHVRKIERQAQWAERLERHETHNASEYGLAVHEADGKGGSGGPDSAEKDLDADAASCISGCLNNCETRFNTSTIPGRLEMCKCNKNCTDGINATSSCKADAQIVAVIRDVDRCQQRARDSDGVDLVEEASDPGGLKAIAPPTTRRTVAAGRTSVALSLVESNSTTEEMMQPDSCSGFSHRRRGDCSGCCGPFGRRRGCSDGTCCFICSFR